MKNKPLRHKSSNRFKFQTFSERIANIDIDVFHHVGHLNESDEDSNITYFYKTLLKCSDLNLSKGYAKLKGEIGNDVHTLPQLLAQKERLVNILAQYLECSDVLSLQPCLELIVALAQDLRREFYPFYSDLLSKVLVLLNTKNTDQLEWTFTCLAYLFKYLWRFMLKDMNVVFGQLLPLLSSSKPQYVNNFAAESFAFVARKVKDKPKFIQLVLKAVKKNNESISGCGRLLFEVLKGVQGQFHSCAQSWVPFLLESLTDHRLPHRLLADVLGETVACIANNLFAKDSKIFWDELLKSLLKQSSLYKEKATNENLLNVSYLLELTLKTLEQKNCCFLVNPVNFTKTLIDVIKSNNWPSHTMILIADISSTILLSPRLRLPQDLSAELVQMTLNMDDWDSIKHFTIRLLSYSGFETLVLPYFIQLSEEKDFSDVLHQFMKIILFKRPLAKCFNELQNKAIYPLVTSIDRKEKLLRNVVNVLDVKSKEDIESNMEDIICSLIVLPQISVNTSINSITNFLHSIINIVVSDCLHQDESRSSMLLLLHQALTAVCSLSLEVTFDFTSEILLQHLLPLIRTDILALQVLELYVNVVKNKNCDKIEKNLTAELINNLASPFHQMRLLSAYTLQSMEGITRDEEMNNILSIIILAESITPSIHEYRDKLTKLQLLECKNSQEQQERITIPLNFLLGNLYINFKLLWEPVSTLIVSYAKTIPTNCFWPVFVKQLQHASAHAESGIVTKDLHSFKCEALLEASQKLASVGDRPDVSNYRILLWQLMVKIPEVCEEKNRDISTLFLNFLQDEYYKISPDEGTSWNIKQGDRSHKVTNSLSNDTTSDDLMDVDSDDPDLNDTDVSNTNDSFTDSNPPPRSASKSLLAHLAVFGCLRSPKSIFREPELHKVYLDFLCHKNPDIQKAALDCIMTYKHKHVLCYKEHLYGLIDDKTFKEEVTLFRIDTDNNLIRPEHREEVIPIVMRIVYSKMLNRSGVRTGSKSAKQGRRSTVFRFLAGCKQEELLFYLKMAFRLYSSVVQDDVIGMVSSIREKLDISSMTPPKRLLSTANMLTVVLNQCGSLLSAEVLRFLLRVLLCVGATGGEALSRRQDVHPPYINILRNIRNTSLDVLTKFFSSFESFPWTADELNAVYDVFVWPYLSKLPIEGIHSPTSLLKLFTVWSQVPRYFPLLVKFQEGNINLTPLPFMMTLLLSSKAHGSVTNVIMDIVERLLSLESSIEDEMTDFPLPVTNVLLVDNYSIKGETTFGRSILYPHISSILERMKLKLSKSKANIGKRDLTVLSNITGLVHDSETSETLLSLLLPIVGKKATAGEHIICPLIVSITNLIKNVVEPNRYIRHLAVLFGSVNAPEPRRMLSALVKSIDRPENGLNSKVLDDLNAWNAKWLDQPDFERRLDAFKTIQQLNTNCDISVELGVIIIYTCFHFIRTEKDMSLRDSASQCLRTLCPNLCNHHSSEKDYLVNKTVLELIASGIRDKKCEPIQQESIILLGYMARECADIHPVLRDLSLLGNKADLEVDFFENLQHLQLHRKVRALLKFCAVSKSAEKLPNTRTLTQFILPIVSQFLCSEKYMNKNTIVDAAIQVLGTVCKMLPWHHYEIVFRFYLNKLRQSVEYQKQLIRIVVEILNSFHFNLKNADMIDVSNVPAIETKNADPIEISIEENNGSEIDDSVNEEKRVESNTNEELNDMLDITEPMTDIDNEIPEEIDNKIESILDRQAVLSKSLATRVIYTIKTILLPQLHRIITARTQSDAMHKVNRKFAGPDSDEEDILRIPIALALVKLLQRLPTEVLESNICGIFMKLCTFLKSRLDSVRRTTRDTLHRIIESLGPKYLHQLFEEMTAILKHGFHVHVLVYSIHSVLVSVKPLLQPGDLNPCVPLILQAIKSDLFGKTAEEKEVKAIAGNLMEARANRSYDMYHILAEFTTQECLMDLIIPLKEELSHTFSHSYVNKGRECLRHIVLGLVDNKFITVDSLLIFAYGTASESIPSLISSVKKDQAKSNVIETHLDQRVDTFLIPKEPKSRQMAQNKLCAQTNAHLFVEFGIQLYYFLLKRDKVKGADYRPHLDPLVKVLKDCLQSKHVKINTLSLQCLSWVVKFDLPSLHTNIEEITQSIFDLLHKYAAAGLSKGDNFDLVMAAFKVVAVLVRDVKYHQLSKKQQQTLLLYCEQDIHDYSRQALAFSLLKAILGRKLQLSQLNGVMEKVAKISITADIEHVRLQARQVFHQYLMNYGAEKKFEKHLTWYLQQLEYDLQPGRESAFEMIKALINTLPEKVLKEQSGFIFVTVAARLVNDDAPACRKMAADIIALLLEKVSNNTRDSLFEIVILWIKDKKVLHRRLAVQLCGIFATQNKESFTPRISVVLPLVDDEVRSEIKEVKPHTQEDELQTKEQLRDHHLYQLMHLVVKITTLYPNVLTENTYTKNIESLAESAQTLLAYPHEWVRLAATQLIGRVLSVLSPSEVASIANKQAAEQEGYLLSNTKHRLKTLSLDLCSQLTAGVELNEKLLMQTMKNLIFIAEVLQHVSDESGESPLSLQWLIRRIRKIINTEIVHAPNSTVLRTICYNWLAAVVLKIDATILESLLPLILAPIVRELNMAEEEGSLLNKVAREAANVVKKKISSDEFNRIVNSLTTKLLVKRAERKKEKAQFAVREPEMAAKRKIKNQMKKKNQKKKKIDHIKGRKVKRKANDKNLNDD